MLDGFPLPDFAIDDVDVCQAPMMPFKDLAFRSNSEDFETICDRNGIVAQTTPLRCTANSTVYSGRDKVNGIGCAIKCSGHKKRIMSEYYNRMELPDSPYLVKTYSVHESPKNIILQMELCEDGDIQDILLEESEIWQLIHDISSALAIIHSNGWMHLDVSPGNILLKGSAFKLADFGTLTQVGKFAEGNEGAGPYASLEVLTFPNGDYPVGPQTDIFSFGVVLLECASGRYAPRGGSSLYSKLRSGEVKLGDGAYQCSMSGELISIINRMLDPNPAKRPTADELSRHPLSLKCVSDGGSKFE